MSLTEKTFDRFWKTMAERYGSRWLETYGDKPTHAWRELLAAYSPKDIGVAIEMLANRDETRQHPPTEPAFKALLQHAARAGSKPTEDPGELRRGYWRSTIIEAVARQLGFTHASLEPVLIANKSLGLAMKRLLDDVDELEHATGQRTSGQHDMVDARCRQIVDSFRQLKAAA